MCGIAGIISNSTVDIARIKRMTDSIIHRGPDGEGHWINTSGKVGFGHRRLSIIDLSENGRQPMHYASQRYTITFNGEIYNYVEIRSELLKKGYTFRSDSDTEVLLALYDLKKEKCLQDLDGMFAFAIWDEQDQRLFCARDRFGEKPFYYHKDENSFTFASEIKQFWSVGFAREFDPVMLSHFLQQGEVMETEKLNQTFYKNIYSLKAGHYLVYGPKVPFTEVNYWNLNGIARNHAISFEEATEQFLNLFNNSIDVRLRSDVPLGSSLSGGLDSSAIVYTINQQFLKAGQEQFTFSARFKNYSKDEGEYIGALLNVLPGIKRADVFLDVEEFEKDMKAIIHYQDEPFQSASIFAQYKVMQLARKNNITVMLDGQGADELLGGYEMLYTRYLKQLFYNKPAIYHSEVQAYNTMHGAKFGAVDFYAEDTTLLKINRALKRFVKREQAVSDDFFKDLLKSYITGSQLQQLLRYADRNAMAHSIETRLPFLNHKLVEFVFSLPDEFKLREGWPKYILRKAFDKKLPDKITWRRDKIGFETPENTFLNNDSSKSMIREAQAYVRDHAIINTNTPADPWRLYMLAGYLLS